MTKDNLWRPTVMTPEIIAKLEEWFMMWLTDVECCLFVNIWTSTLYDYCKVNKDFSDRKEELKHNLKMVAKSNLNKSIKEWDKSDSKWYLERKGKDEFSLKTEVQQETTNVDVTEDLTEEQRQAIAGRFNK